MEKYKVCPVCGKHNPTFLLECEDCEADLQTVPIVDEALEIKNSQPEKVDDAKSQEPSMVRICEECGAKNPVQARICQQCGEDISYIVPVPDTENQTVSDVCKYILATIDGDYAYDVQPGTTVIGRENQMQDYLFQKSYVSRKHAELILDTTENTLTIKNCSGTNYTYINDTIMLDGDKSQVLKDGDEIGLGGKTINGQRQSEAAYFIVRIGSCT